MPAGRFGTVARMTRALQVGARLPLSALLSQALVAFTIEFDNEAERQIQHSTTRHGRTPGGVWLVSMVMWLNCLRYVGADPVAAGEIARLARTNTNLAGLQRWGHLTAESAGRQLTSKARDTDLLVRATTKGLRAQEVWRPLTDVIEQRWADRFGTAELTELRSRLASMAAGLGGDLPDCLPILGHGLYTIGRGPGDDRYASVCRGGPACAGAASEERPHGGAGRDGRGGCRRADRNSTARLASVRRPRTTPRWLARLGAQAGHAAAVPDGAAPRRLSRRQLTGVSGAKRRNTRRNSHCQ